MCASPAYSLTPTMVREIEIQRLQSHTLIGKQTTTEDIETNL
jgi:hypothetical protein